jgi:3-oxoacyl-(acyl-carrier-protein) synthase/acyl carrier protein
MDGAFTSIMGLLARVNLEEGQTYLPFELGELQILKPLPEICYAIAAFSDPRQAQDCWPKKVDIKITDESGEILVDIKDLSVRLLKMPGQESREEPAAEEFARDEAGVTETIYFHQEWEQSRTGVDRTDSEPGKSLDSILIFDTGSERFEILNHRLSPGKSDRDEGKCILVIPGKSYRHLAHRVFEINPVNPGDWGQLVEALLEQKITSLTIAHLWSWVRPTDDSLTGHLDRGVYSLFYLSQELVKRKFPGAVRLLYLYEGGSREELPPVSRALHGAVGGFANSIRQEQAKFVYKTVEIGPPTLENPGIIDLLVEEFQRDSNLETEIRYEAGIRYLKRWREFEPDRPKASREGLLKDKGVYIITGGAGGLGLIIAEYLAREFKAGLVLAGRSGLTPEKQRKIDALEALGAEVMYSRADISDPGGAKRLVQETRSRFGRINGVLHCAGVVRDSLLEKKTRQEMEEVLAPKVYGTFYLDEASKDDPLDFFVMFSSTAVMGNRGQIDYAYGNRFLDKFIQRRERLRLQGQRAGKTLSINWPYWKEGGMKVDEQTEKLLKTLWGMRPLSTPTGLEIFSRGLTLDLGHFMVIAGHRPKVLRAMGLEAEPERDPAISPPVSTVDKTSLAKRVEQDIVKMISAILKIDESNIGLSDDLKEFGFDSISLTELANKLNELYTLELTPTVFFELELPTIAGVARFLCREYTDTLGRHYSRGIPSTPMELKTGSIDDRVSVEAGVEKPRSHDRFQAQSTREIPPATADSKPGLSPEPMAIIGMSGMMPRSKNLEIFWKRLEEGRDLISEIPIDRWDWRAVPGETGESPASKWGGFIDDVDKFDALFFGISPREAEIMDPQQRLFMTAVWNTIEDAGYRASDLSGSKTGLFVGVATMDYSDLVKAHFRDMDAHMATGMTHSVLANRISYFMNWHGPSEPVDTACSSSLVAIHRAIGAIRAGDCDKALVGGVNIMLTPSLFIAFAKAGMLSEDGRCKTFDKRANGYVRGEGAAAIFIKPLGKAEADGDHIYAVIKGSAINHGGHATSLTAPNSNAQAELLIAAYERAQVDPTAVTYIEAHGTGTSLGDPIEIDGLKKAFGELHRRRGLPFPGKPHCGLASVKTNVGHLETAAGIAGLVKVLLSMKYKKLPKNVHFKKLNPYIDLRDTPFYIIKETQPWECLKDENNREIPRLAGVSSFGFGGVNSHVVLEEYRRPVEPRPGPLPASPGQDPALVVFSAKDKDRLHEYVEEIAGFLEQKPAGLNLTDIAYTMQVGREEFEERLALVVSAKEQLLELLKDYCQGNVNHQQVYEGNIEIDNKISGLLIDEAESSELVKSIIAGRKLDKLARLWVSGVKIDWKLLYNHQLPCRISMPTYPFARQRYWIPGPGAGIEAPGIHQPPGEIHRDIAPEEKQPPGETRQAQTQVQSELTGILAQIKQAGFGQRPDLLVTYLKSRVSELLRMDLAKIGENRSLEQFGFDSILILQLKNKINVELDIDVPIEKFVGNVNIQKISDLLLVKMALADIITGYDPEVETDEEMEELVI